MAVLAESLMKSSPLPLLVRPQTAGDATLGFKALLTLAEDERAWIDHANFHARFSLL